MNKSLGRPSAILLAGVTAIALGYGGSAIAGAEAQGPSAKPISKAQVKKIAKAQAIKQINALAPTLSVKSAQTATTAVSAQSAQTAVTAQSAATAAKIGTADVKTFGVDVPSGGATASLGTVVGLTLTGSCPAGVPTVTATAAAAGKLRYQWTSSATPTFNNGLNTWTTGIVNDTAVGGTLGSGSLGFKPGGVTTGMSAWYGWRLDAGTCSFFGTMLGG